MERNKVSEAVVRRLPGYYRYLSQLIEDGMTRISSQDLGARMGLTASQIRQDINCFGTLGQQGYGYNIAELRAHIGEILGVGSGYGLIVIGAGNIGQAVARYPGFAQLGYRVEAVFDRDTPPVGQSVGGHIVKHIDAMAEHLAEKPADIAVIAVPAQQAQAVAERVVSLGVKGIWNFSPANISAAVPVQNVQLTDSLLVLSYHMKEQK